MPDPNLSTLPRPQVFPSRRHMLGLVGCSVLPWQSGSTPWRI
ncbi:MAG: hypothetical protein WKG52_06270 [Variovorax sp.]